ncbi:MAG TPA: SpoIIE family protein phosphatase [Thermoanaerobaculia bacterium]|nr:SpoIIE family protein phosphatase [Thermoanaerobaculia bacterium]
MRTTLTLGGALLAAGLALALLWLPEWQLGRLPDRELLVRRFQALAKRAGIELALQPPAVFLETSGEETRLAGEANGRAPDPELARLGRQVRVTVAQRGTMSGNPTPGELQISFSAAGQPRGLQWIENRFPINKVALASPAEVTALSRLLLAPGESLGEGRRTEVNSNPVAAYAVRGRHREILYVYTPFGGAVIVQRRAGDPTLGLAEAERFSFGTFLLHRLPDFALFFTVAVLFIVLLAKRRIDLANAAVLGAAVFLASAPTFLSGDPTAGGAFRGISAAAVKALWVLLIWSVAESFLRSTEPGFSTSLDALRVGRLGPRAGRALLFGLGAGAAAAGIGLACKAAAAALPRFWPEAPSVELPAFDSWDSPFSRGIALAAIVTLLLGFARRLVPARWAGSAAVVAALALYPAVKLQPLPLSLAANAILLGLLVAAGRRSGLTALLTAAAVFYLLPLAVFAALHLSWLPVTFGLTAGTTALVAVLGTVGLRRPQQAEIEGVKPPAFIRRLEEERRLKYEMDLLARMQLGLLPQQLPRLPGWDIAARSLLATEAGGDLYDFLLDEEGKLWVAAGDVAGHGYSCAIVQAMTTAALSSLIAPGQKPSEVLIQVDRVIRRGGARRNFTSLALLRLDPATGEALLANAGHPFPFIMMVADDDVGEVNLPGLPLGQGPAREYADEPLHLPPGAILVFCSDGLFEAANWNEVQYGYERPREVLYAARSRPAAAILDAMLADWRRHLGPTAPPDDTTVVVIKRAPAG